nr:replication initiation factor domain-containing protein [uncultured Rhodoferax sp.]
MSNQSPLVLDGNEVKLRLEAERVQTGNYIHVDWLRFTVLRRNVVPTFANSPTFSPVNGAGPVVWDERHGRYMVKPLSSMQTGSKWDQYVQGIKYGSDAFEWLDHISQAVVIRSTLEAFERDHANPDLLSASAQAYELAKEVAAVLGSEFVVNTSLKKGQDFYKWRMSIERFGHECAWVGFLASSDSPRSDAQNQTIHVNIQGHACTFARIGWRQKMADLIDLHEAKITRVDLALDMFQGLGYDMHALWGDYERGAFKVRGKNPSCRVDGDWFNGVGRSLYVGCRKSGKETNIYEKGDQLFGPLAGSPWVRAELRWGNQLRVLPSDCLRRPDDFFAGASDWHADILLQVGQMVIPCAVPQQKTLEVQSVLAEVHRNVRWFRTSAAATVATALEYMSYDDLKLCLNFEAKLRPGRLKKFGEVELGQAYKKVIASFNTVDQEIPADLQTA